LGEENDIPPRDTVRALLPAAYGCSANPEPASELLAREALVLAKPSEAREVAGGQREFDHDTRRVASTGSNEHAAILMLHQDTPPGAGPGVFAAPPGRCMCRADSVKLGNRPRQLSQAPYYQHMPQRDPSDRPSPASEDRVRGLADRVAAKRADPEFQDRLRRLMEEEREVLEELASS
jgi:hypothetical protein